MPRFVCPRCQKKLRATEELAGRKCRCSGCGQVIIVPEAPAPASQGGDGWAADFACQDCGRRFGVPPDQVGTGRPILCPHCGRPFTGRSDRSSASPAAEAVTPITSESGPPPDPFTELEPEPASYKPRPSRAGVWATYVGLAAGGLMWLSGMVYDSWARRNPGAYEAYRSGASLFHESGLPALCQYASLTCAAAILLCLTASALSFRRLPNVRWGWSIAGCVVNGLLVYVLIGGLLRSGSANRDWAEPPNLRAGVLPDLSGPPTTCRELAERLQASGVRIHWVRCSWHRHPAVYLVRASRVGPYDPLALEPDPNNYLGEGEQLRITLDEMTRPGRDQFMPGDVVLLVQYPAAEEAREKAGTLRHGFAYGRFLIYGDAKLVKEIQNRL